MALAPGAIVVVGSGQSGCQIVEDLLSAGRTVYLCTSKVGRAPRRYRGRELLEWWIDMKHLDVTLASLEDKSISRAAQPQISGAWSIWAHSQFAATSASGRCDSGSIAGCGCRHPCPE